MPLKKSDTFPLKRNCDSHVHKRQPEDKGIAVAAGTQYLGGKPTNLPPSLASAAPSTPPRETDGNRTWCWYLEASPGPLTHTSPRRAYGSDAIHVLTLGGGAGDLG